MILKQNPAEIFQTDDFFKDVYGSSNHTWRSAVYRAREELGIDMDDDCFFCTILVTHFRKILKTYAKRLPNQTKP